MLQLPSQTLKHLYLNISSSGKRTHVQIINFPHLKVLEMDCHSSTSFPSWITIPPTSMLILTRRSILLSGLPSVSRLWCETFKGCNNLTNRCPLLEELRLVDPGPEQIEMKWLSPLLSMRKQNVDKKLEVDGVRMQPLKRLIYRLSMFVRELDFVKQQVAEEKIDFDDHQDEFFSVEVFV